MKPALFWVVMLRLLAVSYRLGGRGGQHIGPVLKGQAVQSRCPETSTNSYQSTLRNIPEEQRSIIGNFAEGAQLGKFMLSADGGKRIAFRNTLF